jgi:Ca2+-binding RTX toxin-like protein
MAIINGTNGDDTLKGGIGNDTITGGAGSDLALMGGGNDVFVWNHGDSSDTVEGQAGVDTLRFNATSMWEAIDIYASGPRARLHRDVGAVTMDLDDVERIELAVGGGEDVIRIQDLAGTDVKQVAVDLAGGFLPGLPDNALDHVVQFGKSGDDQIAVALINGLVTVTGPSAQLTIDNADATDTLDILGDQGNDVIDASKLSAGVMSLYLAGGAGNDKITGSKGADELYGGGGNDVIVGDDGNDDVDLGFGDDLFAWFAGDGHDQVDGGFMGVDTVRFTDSNAGEHISLYGSNGHTVIAHNAAPQVDAINVERVELRALGGADLVTVGDLAETNVKHVVVDLAGTAGGATADTAVDTVNVHGTASNDLFDVSWTGSAVLVAGLAADVTIGHAGAKDVLVVSGEGGDDILNAAGLPAGKMAVRLFGGFGNDTIFGSAGNDTVYGGDGNDVAYLGGGNDEFVWTTLGGGSDKIEGQAGLDTVSFSGGALVDNDIFYVMANADRARLLGVGGSLDLNDVERVQINTFGGSDLVDVQDLSGTDVKQVAVDLGTWGGGGDGVVDTIYARGSAGSNTITVAMSGGSISVSGLPTQLTIAHADAQDRLAIFAGDGNDVINAATLPANAVVLLVDGDGGNDIITGNAGNNELDGNVGNDTLRGGAGSDTLYGSFDNDTVDGGIGDDRLYGGEGDDVVLGGLGDDLIEGNYGNDTITGGGGNDTFRYEHTLDGHDVISDFDGDAVGGQDVLNLDALFDLLGVANGDRAGRVNLVDNGGTVDIRVNADGGGGNGFELHVATLTTAHEITLGQDIILAA